jgi:hypothetical protein
MSGEFQVPAALAPEKGPVLSECRAGWSPDTVGES